MAWSSLCDASQRHPKDLCRDFRFGMRPHYLGLTKKHFLSNFFMAQTDSSKCYQSTVKILKRSAIYFMYKKTILFKPFCVSVIKPFCERHKTVPFKQNLTIAANSLVVRSPTR